ncbi:Sushi, von Willebrand factor type A, EGF and pentraxin domain-containing protein 1 [Mizuhopecten yessoensis]|uniref:Sushi, von Willebrand factor type A, EGF and pentraxin domain-containing protein 1 n=1 Tax=Mizuhopecten yessoensis TaxID=6573 RepID=A0A210QH12_MIZYE|nr:Sushi, von Willebrand factor type A, EGF and pentraxin domain-containing protein 1 [Mizuhopecten yessoensis]
MQSNSLLLMFYISTLTQGLELEVPQFLHNFCLSSTGYMSISEIGLYGCARRCGMYSGCKSFTYNIAHHRCLLNEDDANTASGQFNACPGFIYGDRAMLISDVTLMGPCSDHDCPYYTTCVRLYSTSRVCVASVCGPFAGVLLSLKSDDISTTMSAVGVSRNIQCDTGYIGYKTVVCLANGLWSELEDTCTDCGNPPSVDNAVVSSGDTTIGSNRVYECLPTTTASGSGDITCQQDGTWSTSSLVGKGS